MKTRTIVFIGLFTALQIILERFIVIDTGIVRIGFGFVPLAFCSIIFGPVAGGIEGVLADVIGFLINSRGGTYFPGFTVSGFIAGMIYGLLLHKKPKTFPRILVTVTIITIFVNMILNTLWLIILTNKSAAAIIYPRFFAELIMLFVKIFTLNLLWKYIGTYIESNLVSKSSSS